MVRPRCLIPALVLVGAVVPAQLAGPAPHVAYAASAVVWHLDRATFDPARGQAEVTQTFTPRAAVYVVEIELFSTDPSDEAYVQLGDNQDDATQVQSGEDRFFAASNLEQGTMPAFRIIADPKHHYAGRSFTYAVAVYTVPPAGMEISGVAVSAVPNVIAFSTPRAATYTVHYALDGGSARLVIIDGNGATVKDFGTVSGEGGATAALPAGTFGLGLEQEPKGSAISWDLGIGLAPLVQAFSPPDRAQLQRSPATLWAAVQPDARFLLDGQAVSAAYDPVTKHLLYRPPAPLAAGLHQIAVTGADGTQAATSSHFLVLPAANVTAPATQAGSYRGLALVRTTTPDGRYSLLKPAAWHMAGSGGTTYLVDARGKALIMLSERYLGQSVDAGSIARTIGGKLGSMYGLIGSWSYAGSRTAATLRAILKGTGQVGSLAMVGRVLSSLDQHSLLIAYGFGLRTGDAPDPTTLAYIEASISANDARAIVAARPMLHYAAAAVALQYPQGWIANFTDPRGSWFIGPNDQAVLIALGIPSSATAIDSTALRSAGQQVQEYVRTQMHARLTVVQEHATPGIYRWLAVFPDTSGQMNGIEVGEIVVHGGHAVAVFGDTTLDQAPTNLPLFAYALDSAARAAGVTPAGDYTIGDAAVALHPYTSAASSNGSTATSGAGKSNAASYLSPYKNYLNEHAAYESLLDSSYGMYAAELNVGSNFGSSGISYSYTSSTW